MKISALRLFNVKRFANRGVALEGIGDGVNVLCAVNEFGKSTSFEALHALFFQPHTSTSGDVRSLRPYSGGNPLVEADISTADGRFRVTKQFYGGRSARVTDLATGRLLAQADEAENFIAGLIRGGTAGPAGLLWVRQGVTGIDKRSRSEDDGEKQARASLLESVQGEVEAITGGRRMAQIMATASQALAELVTATGRARTGGRYAAAVEEREKLAADEQRLAGEVAVLREALDRRAGAGRRLAELDKADDREERRKAIDKAQAAFDAAKIQGGALKAAEAELGLVRARRETVARELAAFRGATERARDLSGRLVEAGHRRDEAAARRRDVAEAIRSTTTAVEAAEADELEARTLLARLDAALKARAQSEQLDALEHRLADAETTRLAIEKGETEFALLHIPDKAVEELQMLDTEVVRLTAIEEAGRPSVSIACEPHASIAVTMDGSILRDGEERSYDGQARLSVPGFGTITLRSNRPVRSDDRLRQANEKRGALLLSLGVDSLAAARKRQVEAQHKDAGLRELRGRLSLLAPGGLPKLREDVASRRALRVETFDLEPDPGQARTTLIEAEERRTRLRHALREIEPARENADTAFVAAETAMAALRGELAQVEAILGPEEERAGRERLLAAGLTDLDRTVAEAEGLVGRLHASAVDLESVEAALKRTRSVEEAAEHEANALRQTIAELNGQIRTFADEAVEEKWRETAEALSAATARVEAFAREVAVLQRLSTALETARSQARELYLKPVMTELRPLLGLLFDDVSISFDEKTLLPQTISRNGQEEDVERLSGGMREQLSVLTRLAFARLLARDGRPAPVILDDALVYSDDDRIERMFDALHRQSRDQQIIVFSCRQRAFTKLGGNILQMSDWQPDI